MSAKEESAEPASANAPDVPTAAAAPNEEPKTTDPPPIFVSAQPSATGTEEGEEETEKPQPTPNAEVKPPKPKPTKHHADDDDFDMEDSAFNDFMDTDGGDNPWAQLFEEAKKEAEEAALEAHQEGEGSEEGESSEGEGEEGEREKSSASAGESDEFEWKEKPSEESVDYEERRYLIGTHSFLYLKDPGLATALILEEKAPEKVYKGLKADKQNYKKLCDELGVKPCKTFLDHMHSQVLDLRNHCLGAKDIVAIAKVLCNNIFVKKLYLSGNFAGQEGGDAIAEMIENNYTITHLDIGGTLITPSMKKICEALKMSILIEWIDLSMNELTNREMKPLAAALLDNPNIKELYLQHNKITDFGASVLGEVMNIKFKKIRKNKRQIKKNETLELLDLSWNRLKGEKDSEEFFEAVGYHPTLKWVNLAGNSINNAAGISQTLNRNEVIEFVDIAYNRLDGKICPVIGKGLAFPKSKAFANFVAGPNLWRQRDAAQMILPLTAKKSNASLEKVDMGLGMCVSKKFLKTKRKVWKVKPDLQILNSQSTYAITKAKPPDPQVLTIKRAKTVCENFETPLEMLMDELRTEPETMRHDEFKKFIKSCNLYKDKVLTETFFLYFPTKKPFEVDCKAIIEVYDKVFPKPKKVEKDKGKGKKDAEEVAAAAATASTEPPASTPAEGKADKKLGKKVGKKPDKKDEKKPEKKANTKPDKKKPAKKLKKLKTAGKEAV